MAQRGLTPAGLGTPGRAAHPRGMTETRTEERRAAHRVALANPRRTRLTGTHSGDLDQRPTDAADQREAGR